MFKHKLLYFILNNKRMKPALFLPKLEAGYGSLNASDWIPDPRRIGYILRDSDRDGLPSGWYSSQQRELFVCIQHSSVTWARTEAFKKKKEKMYHSAKHVQQLLLAGGTVRIRLKLVCEHVNRCHTQIVQGSCLTLIPFTPIQSSFASCATHMSRVCNLKKRKNGVIHIGLSVYHLKAQ